MAVNLSDPIFYNGVLKDIYIKNSVDEYFYGRCWPGTVIFPDFLNPNSYTFWNESLSKLYNEMPFSGIWLDMNEIAQFCDGECVGNN